MKVLDVFCGRGGWSKPFVEAGDEVVGIDIVDVGYPAKLILKDVREVDGRDFRGYGLIIGSPPCVEFSKAKAHYGKRDKPNPEKGLELIRVFNRVVSEAQPSLWAMENVTRLSKWYAAKPIWKFRMGAQATRFLYGNIPIPLAEDRVFPLRILATRAGRYYAKKKGVKALYTQAFSEIPYSIAKFVHDCVKDALKENGAINQVE